RGSPCDSIRPESCPRYRPSKRPVRISSGWASLSHRPGRALRGRSRRLVAKDPRWRFWSSTSVRRIASGVLAFRGHLITPPASNSRDQDESLDRDLGALVDSPAVAIEHDLQL